MTAIRSPALHATNSLCAAATTLNLTDNASAYLAPEEDNAMDPSM